MRYLDFDALERMNARAFQQRHPYPWANPAGLLTDEGFAALRGVWSWIRIISNGPSNG